VSFPDGDEIVARRLFPEGLTPSAIKHKIAESVSGLTFTSGQPQIVTDAPQDPRVSQELVKTLGVRNGIFAPLGDTGRVIGVIFACNKEKGTFTEHDLVLLTTLANHAASAIENIRLQAESFRREREASILYQTSTRLNWQTDLDALLTTIVEGAIEIADATSGAIGQRVGDEIVMRPLVGFRFREPELRLPIRGSGAGLTYETAEPLIVNDLDLSPCAVAIREAAKAMGLRNFLCVPLMSKDTMLGVIKVCNKRHDAPFTSDDLRLLTTFATQAAMVIENARLFHEIKATKAYLEQLIESSVDAIMTMDAQGILTFVSKGGERMLGQSAEKLVGTCFSSWLATGEREFESFRSLLQANGRIQHYETELYTPEHVLSVNLSASLLPLEERDAAEILTVVKDVTGLRKLHEQMVRSERLAAAGLLAAGVAHEIGNPLACISSLTQVLVARATDTPIQQNLRNVQTHVGRIQKIIQDMTHLTRPVPFQFREASLNEIVSHALVLSRYNPAAHRMKVSTALDPALPNIRVAPDQLLQVFLNLILNSADAGGELTITTMTEDETVRIIFADTGRGMPPENSEQIFNPFYSTKEADKHLGLGLFVSHEIVREHGGTIQVESELGRGSTFTVVLPLER
jgi:PAS domain S-box-containing protein